VDQTVTIETVPEATDAYAAAVDLSARYRLDLWGVHDELKRLYGRGDIPSAHLDDLARQVEAQTRAYDVNEEKVDVALALVKPKGFTKDIDASGMDVYTADIIYPKDREHLLLPWETMKTHNAGDFGFHYSPYDFDSNPEKSFFEHMLGHLNLKVRDVEDIYFTGAITDPNKTDFYVEYKDEKGKWRRYTPDFVIRRKPGKGRKPGSGKVFIVEIKAERERAHPLDGENGRKALALRKWEALNPNRLQYQMIFTATDTVSADQLRESGNFIAETDA
jgi:type III restriction enzyme